jgi:hypothetical protein
MMRRSSFNAVATFIVVGSAWIAAPALADDETERARTFFNAGAQAYGAARYADAVRSFEQAYAVAPRPPVLFSLAQAERKLFLEHGDPTVLRRAVAHYKEYLEKVQTGGRRSEALESKAELEGKLAQLSPQQASASAVTEKRKPRVTVFSPTAGAQASFDGGPAQELPYFADLDSGRHRVRVFKDGYFDAEQEISGDKGIDVPVNLPLRDKPAIVTIALPSSGEVFVDGRAVADAPLSRPIEVEPGPHVITIAKNGRKAWSQEVVLERGKPFRVEPKLATSIQRWASYSMLGAGGVALALGGVFALGAMNQESQAQDFEAKVERENLTPKELDEHNRAIDRRDTQRTASIVLASAGGAIAAGGLLLYLFDKPPVALLPPRTVEPGPKPETPVDVSMHVRPYPLLGAGVYGAGLTARF